MAAGPGRPAPSMGESSEYLVRLAKSPQEKTYHIMRFKAPHKCDLEKLVHPTLDRKTVEKAEEEELPETGEGSEFGRKRREEARRRRRGYRKRNADPDDQPWVLKEKKKGGKHFIGRKEGTVNSSSSYFLFKLQDGAFEVEPVKNWYDFVPPVKYNFLDADEAEERFEKRNKTLNYFSIMLSKKLKDGEEGEVEGGAGVKEVASKEKKKPSADGELLLTDSDSAGYSSENDSEDSSAGAAKDKDSAMAKKVSNKKKKRKKRATVDGVEAGEDTDEGEMESREVDYMSDSSSNSELEFLAKEANKALPKDDAVVERKEEEEIDKGFVESSSSEDELTEKGKELRELMKKLSGDKEEEGEEEEEEEEEGEEGEGLANMETSDKGKDKDSPKKKGSKHGSSKNGKHSKKRERGEGGVADADSRNRVVVEGSASDSCPPAKKQKAEVSNDSITEEEVKRYLLRRPIASKDLVRKFINKKTEMDRNRIVEVLHKIIERLKNVEKQTVKGKLFLSLKTTDLS